LPKIFTAYIYRSTGGEKGGGARILFLGIAEKKAPKIVAEDVNGEEGVDRDYSCYGSYKGLLRRRVSG